MYRIVGKFASIKFCKNEKSSYELILAKFKFGDWALAKAMTSSLLCYVLHHVQNLIGENLIWRFFFNSPNRQI